MARQPKKISEFDVKLGAVVDYRRTKRPNKHTKQSLADAIGMPKSNLERRLTGANEFTVSELERVSVALATPAHVLVDEALSDYGGIEKLIAEHVSAPRLTVTPLPPVGQEVPDLSDDEYAAAVTELNRRARTPAEMTDDELEALPSAAKRNPDLENPEADPT